MDEQGLLDVIKFLLLECIMGLEMMSIGECMSDWGKFPLPTIAKSKLDDGV